MRLLGQTEFSRNSLPEGVVWVDLTWLQPDQIASVAELDALVDDARLAVEAGLQGIFVSLPEWVGGLIAEQTAKRSVSTKTAWPAVAAPLAGIVSKWRGRTVVHENDKACLRVQGSRRSLIKGLTASGLGIGAFSLMAQKDTLAAYCYYLHGCNNQCSGTCLDERAVYFVYSDGPSGHCSVFQGYYYSCDPCCCGCG